MMFCPQYAIDPFPYTLFRPELFPIRPFPDKEMVSK